jgi:hypothetical protein
MINPHRKMNIVLGRDLRRACVFAIACSVGASAPHSRLNAQQPPPAAVAKASARPPNILFVVFDDLNDWTTPTKGHPQAQTPTLQSIAARGVNFTNAHVQAPLCNPSRASFLASLRPSTTGIYSLSPSVRTALTNYPDLKDHQLMPAYFASHGYHTVTMGKIFHTLEPQYRPEQFETWIGGRGTGGGAAGRGAAGQPGAQGGQPGEAGAGREGRGAAAADPPGGGRAAGRPRVARGDQGGTLVDWGPYPDRDEDTGDYRIADAAIEQLKGMPRDKPFFMAVGFSMPHVPIYAPAKWFDRLPLDKVQLPPIQHGDRKDTPAFSWYLHWALPEQRLSWLEKFDEEKASSAPTWRARPSSMRSSGESWKRCRRTGLATTRSSSPLAITAITSAKRRSPARTRCGSGRRTCRSSSRAPASRAAPSAIRPNCSTSIRRSWS